MALSRTLFGLLQAPGSPADDGLSLFIRESSEGADAAIAQGLFFGEPSPWSFTADRMPSGPTFKRAGAATMLNAAGVLITVQANVARFDHLINGAFDAATSALLIEPAATNLFQWSEDLTNVIWGVSNTTVSANAGTAPDGNVTADKLIANSGTGNRNRYQGSNPGAGAFTKSVFVKAAGMGFASVRATSDNSTKGYTVVVDLSTGAITSTNSQNSPVSPSATVEAWPNGFYRVAITLTNTAGACYMAVGPCDTATPSFVSGDPVVTGNGVDGILVWGAQSETGSRATSYLAMAATGAARAADVVTREVPAGASGLTFSFDDGSSQSVAAGPGDFTVPTNLNRPRLGSLIVQSGSAIGRADEGSAAFALPALAIRAAGLSAETDAALARPATLVSAAGLAAEADTAFALAAPATLGLAAELDTALARSALVIRAAGLSIETEAALALPRLVIRPAGLAADQQAGIALGALIRRPAGTALQADASLACAARQVLPALAANENDAARALTMPGGGTAIGRADTSDTALGLPLARRHATHSRPGIDVAPVRARQVSTGTRTNLAAGKRPAASGGVKWG